MLSDALQEGAKLAGHSNLRQKIHYVEDLKRKVTDLTEVGQGHTSVSSVLSLGDIGVVRCIIRLYVCLKLRLCSLGFYLSPRF